MNIVFRHHGVLPVKKYGGTERIIFWLMKELATRGLKVSFIGDPRCKLSEYGIELIPETNKDWRMHIPKGTDVVHLFEPTDYDVDLPHLFTIGGNGQLGETYPLNTVFVSAKHAENHGSSSYIYNGVDFRDYPYVKKNISWENFIFLAKASWKVKNLRHCIKACRKAKKNLHIAGGKVFSFSRYIKSYGVVDQKLKIQILNMVDALLFPVRWHEPFGIAIIEAMAHGMPVVGSMYGSLPELINKDVGILCSNYDDFYRAVSSYGVEFKPDEIRNYAESNFSSSKMADDYLAVYHKVLKGDKLNKVPPTNVTGNNPQVLLSF